MWPRSILDLEVGDGEFLVLVGPSGCGKTTTLRMLAGLEHVDEGEIKIDGKNVVNLAPRDRDIAMVFQNYALYPHMNVAQNMGFRATDGRRGEGRDRAARAGGRGRSSTSRSTSSGNRASSPAGSGSGSRWVERSFASRSVFLMDEPLSNLDAKLRVATRAEIRRFRASSV